MARRLVRRRAADDDIAEQLEYLAGRRPETARRYASALEKSFEHIRLMPEIGALRWYGSRLGTVRMWPVPKFSRFLVFYQVTRTTVEVIRVLHSARDAPQVLRSRPR